jgi:TPR repeat protein
MENYMKRFIIGLLTIFLFFQTANASAESFDQTLNLARQGNAAAQCNLGVMYANGEGVPKNYTEAAKWYRLSAGQGNAAAQFNLGLMYSKGEGVQKDDAEAVKWYRLSAAQNNAVAQCNLGWMYENGLGVTKDDAEAVKWYRHCQPSKAMPLRNAISA